MEALLLIDIQNDFLPGGSLAVSNGDEVIPVANELQDFFEVVVATQDWHPPDHGSFASNHKGKKPGDKIKLSGANQVLWPDHCVQNSKGAEFSKSLQTDKVWKVVRKGTDPKIDSYSGFYDNQHKKMTPLNELLTERNVDTVYITGLAADVCVNFTVLDSLELGYKTILVTDGTKAVKGDDAKEKTLKALQKKGAILKTSKEIIEEKSE